MSRFTGLEYHPRPARFVKQKRARRDSLGLGLKLVVLRFLRGLTTLSPLDSHTLQGMRGCDVGADGRLLHGYNQLGYDGEDYLTLNEDLSSWTATLGQISQGKLGDHLKDSCVETLHKHLEKGKEVLLRSGARGATPRPSFPLAACWEFRELGVPAWAG